MSTNPSPKEVKLDSDTKERLERLGVVKHRSPHYLMKEAIVRYLDQEEYNEKINQETLARWEEASLGKVVSHESVDQWLSTWGTDQEGSKPECEK